MLKMLEAWAEPFRHVATRNLSDFRSGYIAALQGNPVFVGFNIEASLPRISGYKTTHNSDIADLRMATPV